MRDILYRMFAVPFLQLRDQIFAVLPSLLSMIIIIGLGIGLAILARRLMISLLRSTRFDRLADEAGLTTALLKANILQPPALVAANIVYGLTIILTLLLGLSALSLPLTARIVDGAFALIPRLVIVGVVLPVGYLISKFLARSVLIAAVNAEMPSARLAAHSVQILIMVFTVAVALEQLGIGRNTITVAFSILFGGIVLALAIAFGLGGRELAAGFLDRRFKRRNESDDVERPFSHL